MDEYLDKGFDYLSSATIGICFLSAILFIVRATIMLYQGWNGVRDQIWSAALLIGIGIVVSGVFFWLKMWSKK